MIGINKTIVGTVVVITSAVIGFYYYMKIKQIKNDKREKKYSEDNIFQYEYYPPLPNPVVSLLNASRLCHLATQDNNDPHLSLMNFTYHQEEEILIMTTRKNTKKYEQMVIIIIFIVIVIIIIIIIVIVIIFINMIIIIVVMIIIIIIIG